MAPPIISLQTVSTLRARIDAETCGLNPNVAGLTYCAVDRTGNLIFSHASGTIGLGLTSTLTLDTVFWLASCTKLITSIACMQLVEQGKFFLDDVAFVEKLAPELRDVKVLVEKRDGALVLVPKERGITLRMLLTHTSGFGYAFANSKLRKWAGPVGIDDFGSKEECLNRPLLHQPGEAWEYGVGLDWAGVLLERVTGMSLEKYFQNYIFAPLELKSISFFPNDDMKTRLSYMHQREPSGALRLSDHLYRAPLLASAEEKGCFCMGGCGCFGTIKEYCQIIGVLLNDGTSPTTKNRILKPETVKEMFTDQVIDLPRKLNEPFMNDKLWLANSGPTIPARNAKGEIDEALTEGWGLSFSLSHAPSYIGRAASTGSWEGLANLFWFIDRENGLGGIIAAQILPYGVQWLIKHEDHRQESIAVLRRCRKRDIFGAQEKWSAVNDIFEAASCWSLTGSANHSIPVEKEVLQLPWEHEGVGVWL